MPNMSEPYGKAYNRDMIRKIKDLMTASTQREDYELFTALTNAAIVVKRRDPAWREQIERELGVTEEQLRPAALLDDVIPVIHTIDPPRRAAFLATVTRASDEARQGVGRAEIRPYLAGRPADPGLKPEGWEPPVETVLFKAALESRQPELTELEQEDERAE